ncbi:MAG: winged helix-turn-helix domain-containing tetratricopeptide repeat protein [Candidatus Acidiferrales bacterium]
MVTSKTRVITFGPFTVDAVATEVRKHGVRLKLAGQPMQILGMLLERPGGVVTREELRAALWAGDTFVDFDHSLNAAVNKLREALGDSADNPRYIETLPRRGYRFIGQVNGLAAAVLPPAERAVMMSAAARGSPRWWVAITMIAVLATVAGLLAIDVGGVRGRLFGNGKPPITAGTVQSLAVLPFANLSGDPEQEYFADGMTEELISQLARIQSLRVAARTSAMQYKQARKPLPEIGRELGVQAVVEGSVMRAGDRVRISAQLVETASDRHLWAQSYERDVANVLALQAEVARTIAEQIRAQLTPAERARLASAAVVNPEAHQQYLLARFYHHKSIGWATLRAIEHYRRAIELDPQYTLAYTGLAHSLVYAPSPKTAMPQAKQMAEKALELDPLNPDAHVALGGARAVWEWDWVGAEQSYRRALELDAKSAPAHHSYALLLAIAGRFDEAVAQAKEAVELDPLAANLGHTLGRIYYFARRYEDAQRQYRRTLEKNPDDFWSYFFLAILHEKKGDFTTAAQYRFKVASLSVGFTPERLAVFEKAHKHGGYEGLLREIVRLETAGYPREDLISSAAALTYCTLGEKEKALEWLEAAFASHTRDLVYMNVEPGYDLIRNDPRFRALLAKMKFPAKARTR